MDEWCLWFFNFSAAVLSGAGFFLQIVCEIDRDLTRSGNGAASRDGDNERGFLVPSVSILENVVEYRIFDTFVTNFEIGKMRVCKKTYLFQDL